MNIYSKIKKKKLLHVFFKFKKNINRISLSPEKEYLQASIVKFKDKKVVRSHHHLNHPVILKKRPIQESWILIKGKAKLTFFDTNKKGGFRWIPRNNRVDKTSNLKSSSFLSMTLVVVVRFLNPWFIIS